MNKGKGMKRMMATSMAAAVLTMAFSASAFAATNNNSSSHQDVVMKIGQSKAYVGSNEVTSATAPVLINNNTYVPLRFVSENFGSDVSFDSKTQTVTIVVDGKTYTIKVGDKTAKSEDGKQIDLGANVQMKDGSVVVPMRGIVENILEKNVAYKDGLIYISDDKKNLDDDTVANWNDKWSSNNKQASVTNNQNKQTAANQNQNNPVNQQNQAPIQNNAQQAAPFKANTK